MLVTLRQLLRQLLRRVSLSKPAAMAIPDTPLYRIYLVRHGETDENRAGIIQGQLDTKLNRVGEEQAALLAERLSGVRFTAVFSSDLQRAYKTAEIILANHPQMPPSLILDPALRERDMGEIQGKKTYDKKNLPKSVESGMMFSARTLHWWHNAISSLMSKAPPGSLKEDAHILVVSHGAYIATLVRCLLHEKIIGTGPEMRLGGCFNTSVTVIEMESDRLGWLERYSDISHLLKPVVQSNADELSK